MKKSQKKILILLLAVIITILVILALLTSIKKKSNDANTVNDPNDVNQLEEDFSDIKTEEVGGEAFNAQNLPQNNQIVNVSGKLNYFKIKSILENYISITGSRDQRVLEILSARYVSEYNVNANNVFNKLNIKQLQNPKQYYRVVANEILTAKIDSNTNIYIVSGNYRIMGNDNGDSIKIMIETNEIDKTYAIYPEEYINSNGFGNIRINDYINFEKEDINKNSYNQFTNKTITDKEMVSEYFNQFRELINYYPDLAYEKLNKEYASKRFGNQNEFLKYREQNRFRFALMDINEYKSEKETDYTDYICTDYYNNIYIFRQSEWMTNYSVLLDDYTIMPNYEKKEYNSLTDYQKAKENVKIFENMLNNKDYLAIYNILDNTFKGNNYSNVDKLREVLNNNVYRTNGVNITDFDLDDSNYYVFKCELENKENSNEKKNMTIIIGLGEETNFTMSFSFN